MSALLDQRLLLPQLAAATLAGLLLGVTGAVTGLLVIVWRRNGHPTRVRVIALAALCILATAIAWLAAGSPSAQQVAVFTNLGGRDWVDAPARAALALLIMAVVQVESPAVESTAVASPAVKPTPVRDRTHLWEVDRLRAVAIIAVVTIHGLPFRAPVTAYLDYWLSDLLRFSVATFFFVSGWLLPRHATGWTWLRHRLGRIVPPYLVATGLLLLLARVSPLIEPRPVLQAVLLGDAVGPYYFVVVLIVLTALTPLIQRLGERARWTLLGVAVLVAFGLEVADLSLYAHNHLPLTWLPYYVAGYQLRPHRDRLVELRDATRGTVIIGAIVIATALALAPIESTPRRLLTGIGIWSTLAALLVLTTAVRSAPAGLTRRLSRQSYLIYLYHPPVVAGLAGAFGSPFVTMRPLVATLAAVATCLGVATLARVVWPGQAGRWLGA